MGEINPNPVGIVNTFNKFFTISVLDVVLECHLYIYGKLAPGAASYYKQAGLSWGSVQAETVRLQS